MCRSGNTCTYRLVGQLLNFQALPSIMDFWPSDEIFLGIFLVDRSLHQSAALLQYACVFVENLPQRQDYKIDLRNCVNSLYSLNAHAH